MSPPLCLFVVSADFGEFVTATLFSRGQPFRSHFLLPPRLAQYVAPDLQAATVYTSIKDIEQWVTEWRPDLIIFASGYLFAVNGLITPASLADFVRRTRDRGILMATTDPWLGVWQMDPQARFDIYSIRRGESDPLQSARMNALQRDLNRVFHDVDHLYAVPLSRAGSRAHSFYNSRFAHSGVAQTGADQTSHDNWLMVLSREDYALLAGRFPEVFLSAFCQRVEEIASQGRNRLVIIGPPEIGSFLRQKGQFHDRLSFHTFCSFKEFEALFRRARVVIYWNIMSSSLLFCLYYRASPIFFGTGHQIGVCNGLLRQVADCVYGGELPPVRDMNMPLKSDATALINTWGVMPWLDRLRMNYSALPSPEAIFDRLRRENV